MYIVDRRGDAEPCPDRGGADPRAAGVRCQFAPGLVEPNHFAQLFSTHGSIMIFFMAMPFLTGLINYVVPLQIGARDMAFPYLNSVGLWLTAGGAGLMMASLVVGEFSTGGWSGYPPYTELSFSGGAGPDYWIWAVTLASVGSTTVGINVACTIYKMRAPGMTWMRMPLFCWTSLCTAILMIFAMPAAHRRDAAAGRRPLRRDALLHRRSRRQHDELRQPVLVVRPSRGLHPRPAGLRRLFGSRSPLFRPRNSTATNRWSWPPARSPCSPSRFGCTTSSPWGRVRTSTPPSVSPPC